ncbi:MAG: ATP-binding protein [Pseudomonadota bacterium]
MAAPASFELASLVVTAGAVAFGVAASVWAFRLTGGARAAQRMWRGRLTEAEDRVARADSVFGAHPGLVIVWDAPPDPKASQSGGDWGRPNVHGSPTALASMLRFADLGAPGGGSGGAASALLDGLADFEARSAGGDETTLRQRLSQLIGEGEAFSLTIAGPSGRFLEADGRAAGSQLVLWLTDATIRGLEESGARARLDEARRVVAEDPLAFLDALNRAPAPAWRTSSGGRLEWANAAYVKAVGAQSLAEVLSAQTLLDPALTDQAAAALKTGEAKNAVRGAVINGERRLMEMQVFPVSGGSAGIALDVTSGEEAKAALKRFRRAHDETLNHMTEAVAIFDRAKRLVFYNRAFAGLFDLEEAMLNERPGHGFVLDRLREKRLLPEQTDYATWRDEELARYEAGPTEETPDELWALPDGRTLRVARQRHPLGGLLVIFEDMTDQLALQARYNTLINVQRATLDRLHEAVAVFGADGRLQLHNTAFEQIWRLKPDRLEDGLFEDISQACLALYPNEDGWASLKARITDPSPEARQAKTGELRRTDGSVLTWLTRPLPDGATLIAWDDVTDSRRIEAALRDRAEALEASERIKTEFVEHVSYQLRTPLTTIGGYADLLAGGYAGDLSDRQKEHMGAIQQASGQLAKLIDDILDIAAIDAGQLELELGDARLDELSGEASELIASRAEHQAVKLSVDTDAASNPVRADAARLKQVLYNLLTNALDHVEAGGRVELGAEVEGEEARLWVADDGAGIAPDRQAAVFERFERGDGGGAGLGLALVNEIVRLHGGWVELESAPGEGTRVTCHLPRSATSDHAAPELDLAAARAAEA